MYNLRRKENRWQNSLCCVMDILRWSLLAFSCDYNGLAFSSTLHSDRPVLLRCSGSSYGQILYGGASLHCRRDLKQTLGALHSTFTAPHSRHQWKLLLSHVPSTSTHTHLCKNRIRPENRFTTLARFLPNHRAATLRSEITTVFVIGPAAHHHSPPQLHPAPRTHQHVAYTPHFLYSTRPRSMRSSRRTLSSPGFRFPVARRSRRSMSQDRYKLSPIPQ